MWDSKYLIWCNNLTHLCHNPPYEVTVIMNSMLSMRKLIEVQRDYNLLQITQWGSMCERVINPSGWHLGFSILVTEEWWFQRMAPRKEEVLSVWNGRLGCGIGHPTLRFGPSHCCFLLEGRHGFSLAGGNLSHLADLGSESESTRYYRTCSPAAGLPPNM